MCDVLIVGGGPAGLMAADYLSKLNYSITIVDQMPTMGRKFLMAGKSGFQKTLETVASSGGTISPNRDHIQCLWRARW